MPAVVFATLSTMESVALVVLQYVPLYYEMKVAFMWVAGNSYLPRVGDGRLPSTGSMASSAAGTRPDAGSSTRGCE